MRDLYGGISLAKNNISIFGSTGFIGSKFASMYDAYAIDRECDSPVEDTDVLFIAPLIIITFLIIHFLM